jgi:hypothetical protein
MDSSLQTIFMVSLFKSYVYIGPNLTLKKLVKKFFSKHIVVIPLKRKKMHKVSFLIEVNILLKTRKITFILCETLIT